LGRATPVSGDMVAIGGCSVLVHVHEQSHRSPLGTERQPENSGKKNVVRNVCATRCGKKTSSAAVGCSDAPIGR